MLTEWIHAKSVDCEVVFQSESAKKEMKKAQVLQAQLRCGSTEKVKEVERSG